MIASPCRSGASLRAFEQLDRRIRNWALDRGCDEHVFPALIAAEILRRAEYPAAFPHLLMTAAVAEDPASPPAGPNLRAAGWFLSPAVCYHAYGALAGGVVNEGRLLTMRGRCFRHEDADALVPGRRQIEFEMRELVLVGTPDWIDAQIAQLKPGVEALAAVCGLDDWTWQAASDPFFLPRAQGKAHMQRLLGTKIELCLPDGLALASINRHGSFFGERFNISIAGGGCAHSACVAFGLDRWDAHELTRTQIS